MDFVKLRMLGELQAPSMTARISLIQEKRAIADRAYQMRLFQDRDPFYIPLGAGAPIENIV